MRYDDPDMRCLCVGHQMFGSEHKNERMAEQRRDNHAICAPFLVAGSTQETGSRITQLHAK